MEIFWTSFPKVFGCLKTHLRIIWNEKKRDRNENRRITGGWSKCGCDWFQTQWAWWDWASIKKKPFKSDTFEWGSAKNSSKLRLKWKQLPGLKFACYFVMEIGVHNFHASLSISIITKKFISEQSKENMLSEKLSRRKIKRGKE